MTSRAQDIAEIEKRHNVVEASNCTRLDDDLLRRVASGAHQDRGTLLAALKAAERERDEALEALQKAEANMRTPGTREICGNCCEPLSDMIGGCIKPTCPLQDVWQPVETMPESTWCRTKKDSELGENECFWRRTSEHHSPEDEREYIDRDGYSTVINPGSFCAPTHWKPLRQPKEA